MLSELVNVLGESAKQALALKEEDDVQLELMDFSKPGVIKGRGTKYYIGNDCF